MHLILQIAGTRGDIQPAIALGLGLKKAGHSVLLVGFKEFGSLAAASGLDFAPLRVNLPVLMQHFGRPELFDTGAMNIRFIPEMIRTFRGVVEGMTCDFWETGIGREPGQCADAILGCPASGWLSCAVAEKLGLPYIDTSVLPLAPTRAFPSIFWPWAPRVGSGQGLAGAFNLFTYGLIRRLTWAALRPLVNRCRRRELELHTLPLFGGADWLPRHTALTLAGYSASILPRPADWAAGIHVTGYWFLDTPTYTPPADLQAFLEAGPPPVYIGFGSMPSKDPAQTAALAVRALRMAGQRGVLYTGAGVLGRGMAQAPVSNTISRDLYFLESAPHDWLFPRMAAVVHHGGSGTTADGLRAGVPSILVPFAADQHLWAQQVSALGLGPRPIPRQHLTPRRLAEAIQRAVSDPAMRQRAAELGGKIRLEDGVGEAVRLIEGMK